MRTDYIVVGSGSAGCALVYRLSEDSSHSVIVIEAGARDHSPIIQMPSALSYPMNMPKYDWGYQSEPEKNLNGRKLVVPRGKVIGGSSSINGMVYVRGHPCDFDFWAENGAAGWSFADVLPYFRRMECWDSDTTNEDFRWRGSTGPLHVKIGSLGNPLYNAFIKAGQKAGYDFTRDYNGCKQEGFARMQQTIHNGRRWSSANAYLKPALVRKNVTLIKGLVKKVIFENKKAVGVEVMLAEKKRMIINANKEVILAASSINSPKILMQSGVGPAEHIADKGIQVEVDRPGVGSNLQDHLEVYIQQACLKPISLYKKLNLISKLLIGTQWLFTRRGLGASNHFESCAFVRSRAGIKYPNIQFHFLPLAISYDGSSPNKGHGFQVHVGPMRSKSRGEVRLRSDNADDSPKIRFNYMSNPEDWVDFRRAIQIAREIFAQEPFDEYRGDEIQPGSEKKSDDQLDEFVAENAESAYHPCGTCKMGSRHDPMAVVDPSCKVIGVENLRVVDSSIFPRITNGNLNAPSIMVGEKASDHILGRNPLPSDNSEPWINGRWRDTDR